MGANMSPMARDKYRLCKSEKHADLNFRAVELARLPKKMLKLSWLTKITLSENLLEEIPDEISVFKNLQHLDASSNSIRTITPLLGELEALRYLNFRSNFLESFPEVTALRSLTFLDISSNKIKTLPPSFFQVASRTLVEFHWAGNGLGSLPSQVSNFGSLRILNISNNSITGIDNVYQIASLEELDASGNQLTSIGSACGLWVNIKKLNFDSNPISTIDDALFKNCSKLQELRLGNGKLTELSPLIASLQQLQTLELQQNQLTALPATIGRLPNLANVNLANNRLTAVPWEIGYLHKTLRKLNLGYNALEVLPGEIGYLSPGCDLNTTGNQLKQPFAEFQSEIVNLLRVAKPLAQAFAPNCTFEQTAASQHVRVQTPSEFTIQAVDFMGTRRDRGGDKITAFAVKRTPENIAAAHADPLREDASLPDDAAASAASGKAEVLANPSTRGLNSIGDAVHPTKAAAGTLEQFVCKDTGDGTYKVFYNISQPGVYDLWLRVGELVFGGCPSTLIVDP